LGRAAKERCEPGVEGQGGFEGVADLQHRSARCVLGLWDGEGHADVCFLGCQDIDDALHARQLLNGNIEAGVRMCFPIFLFFFVVVLTLNGLDIADVSHFVHPDTSMDSEAASRGTTVYLVDKRIDMLPALLGTNLCSLRPFVERLAFSAIVLIMDSFRK
jgi:hypothetical protein